MSTATKALPWLPDDFKVDRKITRVLSDPRNRIQAPVADRYKIKDRRGLARLIAAFSKVPAADKPEVRQMILAAAKRLDAKDLLPASLG